MCRLLCVCILLLLWRDWSHRYWPGQLRNWPKTCLRSSFPSFRSISFTLCTPSFSSFHCIGRFPSPLSPTAFYKSPSHPPPCAHLSRVFSGSSTSCSTFCISRLCVFPHTSVSFASSFLLKSITFAFLHKHPAPLSPSPLLQLSPLFVLFAEFFNSLLLIPTSSPSELVLHLLFNLATRLPFPLPGWLSDAWAGTAGVAGQAAHLHDSCAAA